MSFLQNTRLLLLTNTKTKEKQLSISIPRHYPSECSASSSMDQCTNEGVITGYENSSPCGVGCVKVYKCDVMNYYQENSSAAFCQNDATWSPVPSCPVCQKGMIIKRLLTFIKALYKLINLSYIRLLGPSFFTRSFVDVIKS